jgi:hypothetical protein
MFLTEEDMLRHAVHIKMLEGNPSKEDLCKILKESKDTDVLLEAGSKLLAQDPSEDEMRTIIFRVEKLAGTTWEILKNQQTPPSDETIVHILRHVKVLRSSVSFFAISKNVSATCLRAVLIYVPDFADLACEELLAGSPSTEDLTCIIETNALYRIKAWLRLLQQNPSRQDISFVRENIPSLKRRAELYIKKNF